GEHNIQGIGDKHVPLIHNVMNTDFVIGVSDAATDSLGLLFNTAVGRDYLIERKGVPAELVARLPSLGFSGIANVLGAIKMARQQGLGADDAIITVATDGYTMYGSENAKILKQRFGGDFDRLDAAEVFGQHLAGQGVDHMEELDHAARTRMFNLGYFTWVEQQGVSLQDFQARRDQRFWRGLREYLGTWDTLIEQFNQQTGQAD
ncbi:MAG: pyridoxal-5'-phosphate-dependent protein subunit beta, partial [Myxococcales bacterium]|nr:pyridoxal-5'-phosphate-dependent protein subunit beta [Myxococcales bacterium]